MRAASLAAGAIAAVIELTPGTDQTRAPAAADGWVEEAALRAALDQARRQLQTQRCTQLAQAERLAVVGQVLAGIAHEINNPLAVMLGHLNLMSAELGPAAWSVRSEFEVITHQILRVQRILDSLLAIARPPQTAVRLGAAGLRQLVEEAIDFALAGPARQQLQVQVNLRATGSVCIGREDLQQVLVNLLANAAQALGDNGGRIEVRSRHWGRTGLLLSVRDHGPGIAEALVERVFDPFFTTKGEAGTGLGLAVSLGLMRRYGGHLTLHRPSSGGAEFRIWVREEPRVEQAARADLTPPVGCSSRVRRRRA